MLLHQCVLSSAHSTAVLVSSRPAGRMRGLALLLLAAATLSARADDQADEPIDKAVYKARIEVCNIAVGADSRLLASMP